MGYTKFGELLRILRVKYHEVMGDMAEMLEISLPFLSAVENGKKNVPSDWIDKISNHYGLSYKEREELQLAAEESRTQYKILSMNAGREQRKAAMQFARSFDDMDEETARKITELLNKTGKGVKSGLQNQTDD